jgi:two-component system, NtrC family, C4-dicarboxylate transport response regulator DctD
LAREARARYRREIPDITPELMAEFMAYDWPGNVRELRNSVDRWVLGMGLGLSSETAPSTTLLEDTDLATQMAYVERSLIVTALSANQGSIKKTYEQLGVSRKALYEKMKKYHLQADVNNDDSGVA